VAYVNIPWLVVLDLVLRDLIFFERVRAFEKLVSVGYNLVFDF